MDGRFRFLLAVSLAMLLVSSPSAQRNARRLFASVTSANGAPVLDIAPADFRITENGAERPVTRAALATGPMRIILLIDASTPVASMLNDFRAALNAFVDALPPQHEVGFLSISGQLRVRLPPTI